MFRERTDDKSPETIQYSLLWDLLEVSGDSWGMPIVFSLLGTPSPSLSFLC